MLRHHHAQVVQHQIAANQLSFQIRDTKTQWFQTAVQEGHVMCPPVLVLSCPQSTFALEQGNRTCQTPKEKNFDVDLNALLIALAIKNHIRN